MTVLFFRGCFNALKLVAPFWLICIWQLKNAVYGSIFFNIKKSLKYAQNE
jgi:hypothetical protein